MHPKKNNLYFIYLLLIHQGTTQGERLHQLNQIAITQMKRATRKSSQLAEC